MAIELTWRNIGAMVSILSGLLVAFFAASGTMMEWRIEAVQKQLENRMQLYRYEMEQIDKRLNRLEQRHP